MIKLSILMLALLVSSTPAMATPAAPRISIASIDQLPQPLPYPYDEQADAKAAVAEARVQARHEHKRLLIDMGGNWCLDCRVLAAIFNLPELKPFIAKHFVIVTVDVGRYDKNLDIADGFGAHYEHGAPAVLVVDPATLRLINQDHILALTDARNMTPQGLADWLAQWAA